MFVDNPLRQFAALPFFLLGYAALRQNELIKVLFYCVSGALLHFSVTILFFLWVFRRASPVLISALAISAFLGVTLVPNLVVDALVLISPLNLWRISIGIYDGASPMLSRILGVLL